MVAPGGGNLGLESLRQSRGVREGTVNWCTFALLSKPCSPPEPPEVPGLCLRGLRGRMEGPGLAREQTPRSLRYKLK